VGPLFAIVALSCPSLGIGGTAAILAPADTILWKSLPVERPNEVVFLAFTNPKRPEPRTTCLVSARHGDPRQGGHVQGPDRLPQPESEPTWTGQTDRIVTDAVSLNYFDMLGVDASGDRVFSERVDPAGPCRALAVLSHRYWQRRFGGDRSVVGTPVVLDEIVLASPAKDSPASNSARPVLWIPVRTLPLLVPKPSVLEMPNNMSCRAVARLTPTELTLPQVAERIRPAFTAIAQAEAARDKRGRHVLNMPLVLHVRQLLANEPAGTVLLQSRRHSARTRDGLAHAGVHSGLLTPTGGPANRSRLSETFRMWDALRLDVRHSLRGLRRAPTFSLTVVATLTVAMGATMAVGCLLNALFARRLPVPSPRELVALSAFDPQGNPTGYFYADTFRAYHSVQRSFAQLSMYSGGGSRRVETRAGGFDASTESVSPNYFDVVGVRLSAGRSFTESEDAVVVISEAFRRRLFGNAPGVGETIKVDARPATVIGVAAEGFDGLQTDYATDLIVPLAPVRPSGGATSRLARSAKLVGRLARGVSPGAARAELLTLWPSIQSATVPAMLPEAEREALLRQRVDVEPLASGFSDLRGRYSTTLKMVLALMALLLAVACANLAGLALSRSLTRRHQVAIRLALGGSAPRVFWQLLLDGILLSAVAFAGAVPLAWGIVRVLRATFLADPVSHTFPPARPDAAVLLATALVTAVTGVAIGFVAAWRSVAVRVDEGLRTGRWVLESLGGFGRGLLVAQIALSMTCLVVAGLFISTLARLRANDTSLQSQRIVFTRAYREPGDQTLLTPAYYRALVSDLAHMPGADAAALAVYYPTYLGLAVPLPTERVRRTDTVVAPEVAALPELVSPGFFDLFRLPRLQGRDITWDDGPAKPDVGLVSASLARALFPAGDALGHHLRVAGSQPRDIEIIGVVADAPYGKLDDPRPFVVFRPILQDPARSQFPIAYVRASGDLATVRDGYTRVVKTLGHRLLRSFFLTTSEWVDHVLARERFSASLAGFAAALTSLLACVGVYGMLAYAVTARAREIGVRLALGAAPRRVVWMIVRDGLTIAVPGVLIGVICAWAAARLVRTQLYGIAPNDPRTLLIAAGISLVTAVAASWVPALRASRIAPIEALREE
jgi:putative ABC transport system permease protein